LLPLRLLLFQSWFSNILKTRVLLFSAPVPKLQALATFGMHPLL
jgi:hypothetical protein